MKILIASHGNFAQGIKNASEFILGKSENVYFINAYVDNENLITKIDNFFSKTKKDEKIIVLTDLKGGSVNQTFYTYLKDKRVKLITGINLSLVLQIILEVDDYVDDDYLKKLIENSKEEMIFCNLNENNIVLKDDLFDF